jgi:hypothetical protein
MPVVRSEARRSNLESNMKPLTVQGRQIGIDVQRAMLDDLPHPDIRECYFDIDAVIELVKMSGYTVRCKHCGVWRKKTPTAATARTTAERLLKHWQKQSIVCYSGVLKRWRQMSRRVR